MLRCTCTTNGQNANPLRVFFQLLQHPTSAHPLLNMVSFPHTRKLVLPICTVYLYTVTCKSCDRAYLGQAPLLREYFSIMPEKESGWRLPSRGMRFQVFVPAQVLRPCGEKMKNLGNGFDQIPKATKTTTRSSCACCSDTLSITLPFYFELPHVILRNCQDWFCSGAASMHPPSPEYVL